MTTQLIAQAAAWGCKKHGLINCTQCHEAARVRALEDENERLRAALEAQQAGGEPVTLVRGVPVHGLLPEDRAPMEAIVDAAYAHAAKLRNHPAPVQQVDARHIATGKDLEWQAKVFHNEMDKLGVPRDDGEDFYSIIGRANLALAAQPAAERVGLPLDQLRALWKRCDGVHEKHRWIEFGRLLEQAHDIGTHDKASFEPSDITATSGKEGDAA